MARALAGGIEGDMFDRLKHRSLPMSVVASMMDLSLRQLLHPEFRGLSGMKHEIGRRVQEEPEEAAELLIDAAQNGQDRIVSYLLDVGVDKDVKDIEGKTPLLWAASNGHTAIVKLLLDAGADKDVKDNYGGTPLLWAAWLNHPDIFELLRSRKRDRDEDDSSNDEDDSSNSKRMRNS